MFDVHEEHLRALVMQAETPVLGLLGNLLPSDAREAIRRDVAVMSSAEGYARRLEQFPALFSVWLAEHVMLGLGRDGHFSLYPHLQTAIGVRADLSPNDRDLLWKAFRRAMFKLGMQPLSRIAGPHFMVDEYVRQAGVPIAFADDLARRMLQLARNIGLPDEDDQEGLLTWQSTLLSKLGPPYSVTAKRAVERDTIGYYTRAFVRVHLNGGQATNQDPLEQALGKAFAASGRAHLRRAAIPQLLYRDGMLGVLFPPSDIAINYSVECDGQHAAVRLDVQGGFRAIPAGLHRTVVVKRDNGESALSVSLWPDLMSNRLLVFNAEGRLRASGQLAQAEPVELAPGTYLALCRFQPSNLDNWVEVNDSPRLVEVPLEVRPGTELVIKNGPAAVTILGHNQPSLILSGMVKESLEGLEFWFGDIWAQVEVPPEWLQSGTARYEVRVIHRDRTSAFPVQLSECGMVSVQLASAISDLGIGAGLWRLVLELGRVGEARALQRQSVLYWVGLKSVSPELCFSYSHAPGNLIATSCNYLKIGSGQIDPSDDYSRLVRIAFDVGGGRLVHLSWHRPGVFVEVQVPGGDGSVATIARPLGSAETVSLTSSKTIVISASESGYITLGSLRMSVDFSRKASKAFLASFLASRLEPGSHTLTYEVQSGMASVRLLELSQPHIVTAVKTERIANLLEICVVVSDQPTDVTITANDLSSGYEAQTQHSVESDSWQLSDLGRMRAYAAPLGNSYSVHVQIDVDTLRSGIWILEFGARIGGVWGRLQDADEGSIAVVFAVDEQHNEIRGSQIVANVQGIELSDAALQLVRINDHFRRYWSPVCWEQQKCLTPYFSALIERLRDHEGNFVTELVDTAMCRPADFVRPGFLSMQFAPARLNRIFGQPRSVYRSVNEKPHPLSVALRSMPELRGAVAPVFKCLLHPVAVTPFANLAEICRGVRPRGFSLGKFWQALQQAKLERAYQLEDELFLPNRGELLGPLHIAHAWKDLERGFLSSQLMPNSRKSAALALARRLSLSHSRFDQSALQGLRGQGLLPLFSEVQVDPDQQLKWEHMGHIALACAWLAWYCRLEQRQASALTKFHNLLAELRKHVGVPDATVADCIAYYLQVAPSMFAFYLLLWELVQTVELDPVVQNV